MFYRLRFPYGKRFLLVLVVFFLTACLHDEEDNDSTVSKPDSQQLEILSISPDKNLDIVVDSLLSITFNQKLDPESITTGASIKSELGAVPGEFAVADDQITFTPSEQFKAGSTLERYAIQNWRKTWAAVYRILKLPQH